MNLEPLTDADFESVADVLKHFGGKQAMNIEQLDGFLAALICCPDEVPPNEYLPEIWGDAMIIEDTFVAQPVLQEFLSLVERHRSVITHTLQSGEVFMPILLADHDGKFPGNDWAAGFTRGMQLRKDAWSVLLEDDTRAGSLVPILALAHEHDPDPEMRPYKEPVTEERREQLIVGVAAGVMIIYKYFKMESPTELPPADSSAPYRRIAPKTGRNDPCPCGSGKKFKQCCGKVTLH